MGVEERLLLFFPVGMVSSFPNKPNHWYTSSSPLTHDGPHPDGSPASVLAPEFVQVAVEVELDEVLEIPPVIASATAALRAEGASTIFSANALARDAFAAFDTDASRDNKAATWV